MKGMGPGMSDVCDKLNNCDCMKKMAFILVFGAVVCAFKGQTEFEKQVLGYFLMCPPALFFSGTGTRIEKTNWIYHPEFFTTSRYIYFH